MIDWEWVLAYLSLGAIVGFFAGLFGIGGGLLLVPVLLLLFDKQHFPAEHNLHLALGTTMATILFTSLASMRKHHQHGAVNWQVVRTITPGCQRPAVQEVGRVPAQPVRRTLPSRAAGVAGGSLRVRGVAQSESQHRLSHRTTSGPPLLLRPLRAGRGHGGCAHVRRHR